ncbi:MAG: dihydroorotase [Candidatus Micrarchaeia archaeon]
MKFNMPHIDPHVHCRDWNEDYKATIKSTVELAAKKGIIAVFDMPNTNPPIVSKKLAERRLRLAASEGVLEPYYLYAGITKDEKQIKEVAGLASKNRKVVGLKMFAGKSVGDLAIADEEGQKMVYETLAEAGYEGIVAVHCEKEKYFDMKRWDPEKPYTWNLARPPIAELESVKDQIRFASSAGFNGTLHIAHVSTPEAVAEIDKARRRLNITCGATPHHLLLSTNEMRDPNGLAYKVNPPLRDEKTRKGLLSCLKKSMIDWIETDNAPHTRAEKTKPPYMSGIQSLKLYGRLLDTLYSIGLDESSVYMLTYANIVERFGMERRGKLGI